MKLFFFILIIFCPLSFGSDIISEINYSNSEKPSNNFINNFSVGYFVNISGPTLSDLNANYTYSRFQSGKTWDNKHELDPRINLNYFNSFSLKFKINNYVSASYSYSFENVLSKEVTYRERYSYCQNDSSTNQCKKDDDGFYLPGEGYYDVINKRKEVQSFYNQRIGLFFSNFLDTNLMGFSSGITLELPTTELSRNDQMNFALVLTPSVYFKNIQAPHHVGIRSEFIKNSYQQYVIKGANGANARSMRSFQVTLSPYYNYSFSQKLQFKSSLTFDWDQKGNQTGFDFNDNMDDVYRVGLGYSFNNKISSDLYIEGALSKISTSRSFIGASLSVTI